jgi:hypothetical protein
MSGESASVSEFVSSEVPVVEQHQPASEASFFDDQPTALVEEQSQESQSSEESVQTEPEPQKVEESKEEKAFSAKFAALSRKEKQIRQKEAQIESRLKEIDEKLAQINVNSQTSTPVEEPFESRLKKNPLEALKSIGLGYEKLTELALNDGKLTPEMQLELVRQELDQKYMSELEKVKQQLEERDKQSEEQKLEATVNSFKNQIKNFVATNPDYELIQANDASEVVFEVIEEHYKENGRILETKEAADLVEAQLLEEAQRLFKLNKIKSKFGTSEVVQKTQPKASPTLSNTQSAPVSKNSSRILSREESLQQAASMLRWED